MFSNYVCFRYLIRKIVTFNKIQIDIQDNYSLLRSSLNNTERISRNDQSCDDPNLKC